MKIVSLLVLILVSYSAAAQKYALIDRDFKKPILYTDSVTINQVSNKYFPVNAKDFDSLFANITYISGQLKSVQRAKFKSYKLRSGSTIIQVVAVPHAYGDAYNITLSSKRATVIVDFLLAKGIAANRITAKGFGNAIPLSDNLSKKGRQENRRVEFKIVKM